MNLNLNKLSNLLDRGLSIRKIAKICNKGYSTIRYWMKKYNLKPQYNLKIIYTNNQHLCKSCNTTKSPSHFYTRKNRNNKCMNICKKCYMNKYYDKDFKYNFINYKGTCCEICLKTFEVVDIYDFHHKNPLEKEFNLSRYRGKQLTSKVKYEIDKCHLLCRNCHCEVHGGIHPNFLISPIIETKIITNGKKCSQCMHIKNYNEFHKNHGKCKICYCSNIKRRMQQIKRECVNYKGGSCEHCGYNTYIGALEFHHTDSTTKEFNISRLGNRAFGPKHINELDKCICLCSNCHRIEHYRLKNLK
jgi:hypothetical protein